jgi:hypothetical protein
MCFELDSLPPIPIISGAAVSHDELVLETSDANKLAAFAATPLTDAGVEHEVVTYEDAWARVLAFIERHA